MCQTPACCQACFSACGAHFVCTMQIIMFCALLYVCVYRPIYLYSSWLLHGTWSIADDPSGVVMKNMGPLDTYNAQCTMIRPKYNRTHKKGVNISWGITTCLLNVGPPFGNRFLNTSWAVSLTHWIEYFHFFLYFDICNYICLDTS